MLVAAAAAVSSCRDDGVARGVLRLADSLIEERPDSSLALLHRDSLLFTKASKAVRMAYALSRTEAEDKCYVTHTSDSAIRPAAEYFAAHGPALQAVRAWYVLGRVYCDLRLYGHALTAFDNALAVSSDSSRAACRYKTRACSWTGDIYEKKDLHRDALRYNKRAYRCAVRSDLSSSEVYALRDIGRSYSCLKRNDIAIPYYKRAAMKAEAMNDTMLYNMVMEELAAVYLEEGRIADAGEILLKPFKTEIKEDIAAHYFTLSDYFETLGQLDSAMEYNLWGMDYGSTYFKRDVSLDLARVCIKKGKRDEALKYYEMYFAYADSLRGNEVAEDANMLSRMERMLGVERENAALAEDKAQLVAWLSVVMFAVFVAVFFAVRYYFNARRRIKEQNERVKKYMRQQNERETRTVLRNNERIRQLENELASSSEQQRELSKSLVRNEAETLALRNKLMAFERERSELLAADFKETEIYKLYHDPTARPTPADFHRLVIALDMSYDNFTQRLKDFYPNISNIEMWICCMVKIGLSPKEISSISAYSLSALSMAKSRLYAKMFNKKGSAKELDTFLRDF